MGTRDSNTQSGLALFARNLSGLIAERGPYCTGYYSKIAMPGCWTRHKPRQPPHKTAQTCKTRNGSGTVLYYSSSGHRYSTIFSPLTANGDVASQGDAQAKREGEPWVRVRHALCQKATLTYIINIKYNTRILVVHLGCGVGFLAAYHRPPAVPVPRQLGASSKRRQARAQRREPVRARASKRRHTKEAKAWADSRLAETSGLVRLCGIALRPRASATLAIRLNWRGELTKTE
ncbi:hypothetical protein GGI35DRAFT_152620 [Trichoderma velutinum]